MQAYGLEPVLELLYTFPWVAVKMIDLKLSKVIENIMNVFVSIGNEHLHSINKTLSFTRFEKVCSCLPWKIFGNLLVN